MRQIFLDTETTGLDTRAGDRIVEIGCVELVNRKLTGRNLHYYLNPGRDSHPEALKVHGLSNEFLRDQPAFSEVVDDLLAYVHDSEVYIHNAPFDLGFLNCELALLERPVFAQAVSRVVDTLAMAKEMYPGKRNSLDALCARLGVDNSGRQLHGALLDAQLLAEVYLCLTRGQDALLIDTPMAAVLDRVGNAAGLDLRAYQLPITQANAAECAAHEAILAEIDRASAGKTVWPH